MEERYTRRDGAVHRYFELTYANWLILPKKVKSFASCLRDYANIDTPLKNGLRSKR